MGYGFADIVTFILREKVEIGDDGLSLILLVKEYGYNYIVGILVVLYSGY